MHLAPRVLRALWRVEQMRLRVAKRNEAALRPQVIAAYFAMPNLGTNHAAGLTLTLKETYSCDGTAEDIGEVLQEVSEQFPNVQLGAVFSWKASVNATEFKALPLEVRNALAPIVTIKPAAPTLEDAG